MRLCVRGLWLIMATLPSRHSRRVRIEIHLAAPLDRHPVFHDAHTPVLTRHLPLVAPDTYIEVLRKAEAHARGLSSVQLRPISSMKSERKRIRHQGVLLVAQKCANPECLAELRRLGDGMLFRVPRAISNSHRAPRKRAATEYFWLCSKCTETMTLEVGRGRSVRVIPVLSAMELPSHGGFTPLQYGEEFAHPSSPCPPSPH